MIPEHRPMKKLGAKKYPQTPKARLPVGSDKS